MSSPVTKMGSLGCKHEALISVISELGGQIPLQYGPRTPVHDAHLYWSASAGLKGSLVPDGA